MSDLLNKKCVPCEGGILPFDISEIHKYQKKVDGWDVRENEKKIYFLEKKFTFKNFINSHNFIIKVVEISEAEAKKKNVQIVNLGKRLNAALASKVQELSRHRSEFFGRLRDLLGKHQGIRIVGDRFVFQSEVFFAKSEAEIAAAGQAQLDQLATTLLEIALEIPGEIDWILRIDGHTDNDPISTSRYPSNWELSTARAISVVRYLINAGLPANRLVAAGFGEFHPIDKRNDEISQRRNRRIELKLTQR